MCINGRSITADRFNVNGDSTMKLSGGPGGGPLFLLTKKNLIKRVTAASAVNSKPWTEASHIFHPNSRKDLFLGFFLCADGRLDIIAIISDCPPWKVLPAAVGYIRRVTPVS